MHVHHRPDLDSHVRRADDVGNDVPILVGDRVLGLEQAGLHGIPDRRVGNRLKSQVAPLPDEQDLGVADVKGPHRPPRRSATHGQRRRRARPRLRDGCVRAFDPVEIRCPQTVAPTRLQGHGLGDGLQQGGRGDLPGRVAAHAVGHGKHRIRCSPRHHGGSILVRRHVVLARAGEHGRDSARDGHESGRRHGAARQDERFSGHAPSSSRDAPRAARSMPPIGPQDGGVPPHEAPAPGPGYAPGMPRAIPTNAYPHPVRVAASDVDVQGRVANHAIVRLLVEAAQAHSVFLGWDLDAYRRLGAWWVVRRHEVDYLQPAETGDALICHTWPSGCTKARADRRHVLVRPSDGAIIARALNVWALIDIETGRPRRFPAELITAFDPAQWATPSE